MTELWEEQRFRDVARDIDLRLAGPELGPEEIERLIAEILDHLSRAGRGETPRERTHNKLRCVHLLGELGERLTWFGRHSPAALEALSALLADTDYYVDQGYDSYDEERVSAHARAALQKSGTAVVPALARALGNESLQARQLAATTLAILGPSGPAALVQALETLDPGTRRHAISALGTYPTRDVRAKLERLAAQDPSAEIRYETGRTLGKILVGDPDQPALVQRLLHEAPTRLAGLAAAHHLAHAERYRLVDSLLELLENPDRQVRMRAAENLSGLEESADRARGPVPAERLSQDPRAEIAVTRLIALLSDPEPALRVAAARALGSLGSAADRAVPALIACAESEYAREMELSRAGAVDDLDAPYAEAVKALGCVGRSDPRVEAALVAAMMSEWGRRAACPRARWYPHDALNTLVARNLPIDLAHVPALVARFRDPKDRLGFSLARLFGALGESAPPELVEACAAQLDALTRGDPVHTEMPYHYILEALGRMGRAASSALPAIERAAQHRYASIAGSAKKAAARIQAAG